MYEFWCDHTKPKYKEKAKLCNMDRENFIACIKTEHNYRYISKDVIKRFDT